MTYYHVSSYLREGDYLTRKTKNNFDYCCYASICDVSTYEKFIECYQQLCLSNVQQNTGRTAAKWICEAVFEYVRKNEFSDKPSRIWGFYLSSTTAEARTFLQKERQPWIDASGNLRTAHIFEINIPDTQKVHCFNMDFYTEADRKLHLDKLDRSTYNFILSKAREYWKGNEVECNHLEYLVDCDIKVGKKIG